MFSNVHGWGADHDVSTDLSNSDGHAQYGVTTDSTAGPAQFVGCVFADVCILVPEARIACPDTLAVVAYAFAKRDVVQCKSG